MSMFIIWRNPKYVVMLADQSAHRIDQQNTLPMTGHKLTYIAPCVYGTHSGYWSLAYYIFSNFREFLLTPSNSRRLQTKLRQ